MEVQLAAGAVVDLATRDDLSSMRQELLADLAIPTIPRRFYKCAQTPAGFSGTQFLIEVSAPSTPVGWDVRRLCITGSDDHTSVANVSGAIYVGQAANQTVSLLDLAWQGLTVPSSNRWNREVIVGHNERLYVLLSGSGLSASQVFIVTGAVVEVEKDRLGEYLS